MSESLLNIKTMNTESHYRNHLANFYSWMFGDFKEMVVRQLDLFKSFSIQPASSKVAIDLGSGSGFQFIALIQRKRSMNHIF